MVDEIIWLQNEIIREQNIQSKGEKDSTVGLWWEGWWWESITKGQIWHPGVLKGLRKGGFNFED